MPHIKPNNQLPIENVLRFKASDTLPFSRVYYRRGAVGAGTGPSVHSGRQSKVGRYPPRVRPRYRRWRTGQLFLYSTHGAAPFAAYGVTSVSSAPNTFIWQTRRHDDTENRPLSLR